MAIKGIEDLQKDIDNVTQYVRTQLAQNAFSSESPLNSSVAAGFPSPLDYVNYFKLIADKLNTPDGAAFLAKQGVLKSMNPVLGMGKLYNPLAALSPLPFAAGEATDILEAPVASANQSENIIIRQDRLRALSEGRFTDTNKVGTFESNIQINQLRYSDGKNVQQKNSDNNLFDADNTADRNQYIENANWNVSGGTGRSAKTRRNVQFDVPDLTKIFDKKTNGPAFLDGNEKGTEFFKPKNSARQRLQVAADDHDWADDHDTFFSEQDFQNGYSEEVFQDSELYIPFYFEDLRKVGRKVIFRAFLDNFSESIMPKWQQEDYFGRIDPVVTYKNTGRVINVSFKIMPMSTAGFSAMWKKINNLSKMCLPTFRNGVMVKSPVIRMRIGDVIADVSGNGLPGYIDKLDFNYSNSVWETQSYSPGPDIELGKAPMKIEVSLAFVVIHESNPALDDNYGIDFSTWRRLGVNQEDTSSVASSTTDETNPTPDSEPQDTTSTTPELGT